MEQHYSLIGPNLYLDARGRLFEKQANVIRPVQNKYVEAEERFVRHQLSKGASEHGAKIN